MPQFMHDGGESMRMGRERKAQERLQKRQRVRETGSERKGHRETKRKRKRERARKRDGGRVTDSVRGLRQWVKKAIETERMRDSTRRLQE